MADLPAIALGSGLTLAGTALAEGMRLVTSFTDRSEQRAVKRRDYALEALDAVSKAAGDYRTSLMAYNRALQADEGPSDDMEERLQSDRAAYQAQLYRVDQPVTLALQRWCDEALKWSQREGSAQKENDLWERAMKECGDAIKQRLR